MHVSGESIVRIKVVVPAFVCNQVLAVYASAEPFKRIVIRIGYLQVVYYRTFTYRTESDTVDFLILFKRETGKLYTNIFEYTGVIVIVIASRSGSGTAI